MKFSRFGVSGCIVTDTSSIICWMNFLYEKFGNHFKKNRPKLRRIIYQQLKEEGKIKEVCTNLFVIQN